MQQECEADFHCKRSAQGSRREWEEGRVQQGTSLCRVQEDGVSLECHSRSEKKEKKINSSGTSQTRWRVMATQLKEGKKKIPRAKCAEIYPPSPRRPLRNWAGRRESTACSDVTQEGSRRPAESCCCRKWRKKLLINPMVSKQQRTEVAEWVSLTQVLRQWRPRRTGEDQKSPSFVKGCTDISIKYRANTSVEYSACTPGFYADVTSCICICMIL